MGSEPFGLHFIASQSITSLSHLSPRNNPINMLTTSIVDSNIKSSGGLRNEYHWKKTCLRGWSHRLMANEPRCEKTGLGVSDQVPHKPGCTTTEDN